MRKRKYTHKASYFLKPEQVAKYEEFKKLCGSTILRGYNNDERLAIFLHCALGWGYRRIHKNTRISIQPLRKLLFERLKKLA